MFLYYTRGLVRWVVGVHCGDMGAMKAEGQARLEPPRNPGYAHTGYCVLAEGYVESGVVGNYEYADGNGFRGVTGDGRLHGGGTTQTTEGQLSPAACVLLCALVAALRRTEKPLLSTCCDAAALLCIAPLPPANKRASARRRC